VSVPRYPEYKDSEVEWMGEVPAHWRASALKYSYEVFGGSTPSSGSPELWDGGVVWVTPADLSKLKGFEIFSSQRTISDAGLASCGTRLLPPGTIILSTRAPIGSLGIAGAVMTINQGCKGLVPRKGQLSRFGAYSLLVMADELNIRGRGTTFLELSADALGSVEIPTPPASEQEAIADFLDHETARIDALVEEQQRLIELLKEKRQAVISHAVTKGLDPDVPMKDSGVEWLGNVPAHWTIRPLMHLTPPERKIMYGIVLPGPDFDGGVPIVKGGDVKPGRLSLERLCRTDPDIELKYQRSRLLAGDLVYSIRGGIGDVEIVPKEIEGANLTQDAARISPAVGVDNRWLLYALKSKLVFSQLEARATGATIRGINIMDLKRARLPVPPSSEQRALADYLDITITKLDRLEKESIAAIELMQEHRSALISAAVTGKIDVRSWTPPRGESVLSATDQMETA